MPTEHLREDGKLAQGYFCYICGQPCSMGGHKEGDGCEPNILLVRKLHDINLAGSMEQYLINKLKGEYDD